MNISNASSGYRSIRLGLKGDASICMTENRHMTVDGCNAIISYDENMIKLRLSSCFLTIIGTDFAVSSFSDDGVIIGGEIHSLEFERITEKRNR